MEELRRQGVEMQAERDRLLQQVELLQNEREQQDSKMAGTVMAGEEGRRELAGADQGLEQLQKMNEGGYNESLSL